VYNAGGRVKTAPAGTFVTCVRARTLGKERMVVGDLVDVVGDLSGRDGTLARIVRLHERSSVLRRTADDTDPYERIVVANADQLLIVVAGSKPTPREAFCGARTDCRLCCRNHTHFVHHPRLI